MTPSSCIVGVGDNGVGESALGDGWCRWQRCCDCVGSSFVFHVLIYQGNVISIACCWPELPESNNFLSIYFAVSRQSSIFSVDYSILY